MKYFLSLLVQLFLVTRFAAFVNGVADDWIATTPLTAYETEPIRFQNEDYDFVNNVFRVQTQYVDNQIVSYYKFRVYSDEEGYTSLSSSNDIPMNKIYLMTTDNALTGVIGRPILAYHHLDNSSYSDFAELLLVPVPTDFYEANLFRSELDVLQSGQAVQSTGIVVNMPLVPINSRLQDPRVRQIVEEEDVTNSTDTNTTEVDNNSTDATTNTTRTRALQTTIDESEITAPIEPVIAWYKGVDVWMYIMETNDIRGAEFFAYTRPEANADPSLQILINSQFAVPGRVQSNPLYFLNAYTTNVTAGVNNGGPNVAGMRNVVPYGRTNPLYSPLVQLNWVKTVPMDFRADQVQSASDVTEENGFQLELVAWFINAPIVGSVSASNNDTSTSPTTNKSFLASVSVNQNSTRIMGSEWTFRNIEGIAVELLTPQGAVLAQAQTNEFGVYEMTVSSSDIPEGVDVVYLRADGTVFRTVAVNDYIGGAPPTIYEIQSNSDITTPSQLGYNPETKLFSAHSLWYNDRLTHMFMFYTYSATTSPNLITAETTTADLPLNTLYVVTPTDLSQMIGAPIVVYHHIDAEKYSDYMEIVYVRPPTGYAADTYRSEGNVLSSNAETVSSGIYVNAPIVPMESALQDPVMQGNATINAVSEFWYRGAKVQAFVMEASNELAANTFDPNRALTFVTGSFLLPDSTALKAALLYYLNQYTNNVTTSNVGGPSFGMRNIIDVERADGDSYSSLRQLAWVNDLPINYGADQVSSSAPLTSDNFGFSVQETAIWINAPCIGAVDTTLTNPALVDPTTLQPRLGATETNRIMGSAPSLAFVGNATVRVETTNGAVIQSSVTNAMGGYQFELLSVAIPQSSDEIVIVAALNADNEDETVLIRTLPTSDDTGEGNGSSSRGINGMFLFGRGTVLLLVSLLFVV
ncbi:hypothetical protein FisN_31Hh001 [Fistulifera solaris]|jgi:hypothetical protein|uniref:Uncharacterized protein n=1 Tax=Fistulifera solaris TaxID=1519565 RepID=A0A1Z5JWI3_FISSO|nr:hypothetical protein FisN_31Hh001 [Fistulifera solaris]|eukprot:GAX18246.1 hypothetical protein FisN_31Hh001 [Fistulifera solaris]